MSDLGNDPRPIIIPPRDLVPVPVAIGLGAVLALGLLVSLLSGREDPGSTQPQLEAPAQIAPPELVVPKPQPPPATRQSDVGLAFVGQPLPRSTFRPEAVDISPAGYDEPVRSFIDEPDPQPRPREGGATLVVLDRSKGSDGRNGPIIDVENSGDESRDPRDGVASATQIRNRSSMIPQGAIIAAVLETPLNSDRPGLARAIVSQDVRSFDGTRILVPRGSRLVGDFNADGGPGLRRIPVMWTRLIRSDGVAIRIRSPGADALGGAGIGGRTNTHLAERLFGAVLQSALTIGVNVISTLPAKNGSQIYVGLPGQAQQVGDQLVPKTDRQPTVKVREGTEISVLVARDLDFSSVPGVR